MFEGVRTVGLKPYPTLNNSGITPIIRIELITDYDTCQTEIEQLVEDNTIDECYAQIVEFEINYYQLITKAQKLINELKPEEPDG